MRSKQRKSSYSGSQGIDFETTIYLQLNRIGETLSTFSEFGRASILKATVLEQQIDFLEIILMPFLDETYFKKKEEFEKDFIDISFSGSPEGIVNYFKGLKRWFGLLVSYAYNAGVVKIEAYDTKPLEELEDQIETEQEDFMTDLKEDEKSGGWGGF